MADAKKASNRLPSGVTQFDEQASAPPADSTKAQIYSKEVAGGGGAACEVLAHFDNDVTDDSGNTEHGTLYGSPYGGASYTQYIASTVTGSGFEQAIQIRNASAASDNNYVTFPDVDVGTSDVTIEFFYAENSIITDQAVVTFGSLTEDEYIMLYTGTPGGTGQMKFYQGLGSGSQVFWDCDWAETADQFNHFALVRAATSETHAQWDLYFNGVKQVIWDTSAGSPYGNIPIADISGNSGVWRLGRSSGAVGLDYPYAMLHGYFDEFRITKSAVYTENFTPPAAPFTVGGGATSTKLFVMDSAGNETQLG